MCEHIFLFVVYILAAFVRMLDVVCACARSVQNNESENANGTLNSSSLVAIIMI